MSRVRVVIQSRLTSSRLPGKALLTIGGMPLAELVARRAARGGHEVVVATSVEPADDLLAGHLRSVGIRVHRGRLDDVLGRFVGATADLADGDRVVRLTGDNPMADGGLVSELLEAMDASGHRYGRVDIERVPEGLGAEAFDVCALRQAHERASAAYDREHVTPWLRRELGELLLVPAATPADVLAYRATVDSLHDYERMGRLFAEVADPVGTPWQALMAQFVRTVDASGPRLPASARRSRLELAPLLLDADALTERLPGEEPAEHGARVRALLADAVDHGVTHVRVSRAGGAEEALRAGLEPALVRRLAVVCVVRPRAVAAGAPEQVRELAVRAGVERSLAGLGGRSVAALVHPSARDAAADWPSLLRYAADGVAAHLGVVVGSRADLEAATALERVSLVEVHDVDGWTAEAADRLVTLRAAGVAVVAVPPLAGAASAVGAPARSEAAAAHAVAPRVAGSAPAGSQGELPLWASAVQLRCLQPQHLSAAIERLSAQLTPE